jgi:transposase
MPKSRPPYPPEFRQRIIELVRKGRTPESLAEQFEPTAQTIRNWLAQADRDAGQRPDGLTTDEREEFRRLRRENKTLREERKILKKAAAWFAKETGSTVVDQWSRSSPILEVASRMSGYTVGEALDRVLEDAPRPRSITVDHGTEFQSRAMGGSGTSA